MGRWKKIIGCFLLTCAAFCMCRMEVSANTKEQAAVLSSKKEVTGAITANDTEQWYQMELKSSGRLELVWKGDSARLQVVLSDAVGKEWEVLEKNTANGTTTQCYELSKGSYFYCVRPAENVTPDMAGEAYTLKPKFKSAKAACETNNSIEAAAKNQSKTGIVTGHLAQNAPVEYFKFTIKKPSVCQIAVNTGIIAENQELGLSIYKKDGTYIGNDFFYYMRPNETGEVTWIDEDAHPLGWVRFLQPGSYYFSVTDMSAENVFVEHGTPKYGKYQVYIYTGAYPLQLDLKYDKTEYTGKSVKMPEIKLKGEMAGWWYLEGEQKQNFEHDLSESYLFEPMFHSTKTGRFMEKIKSVGLYCIAQGRDTWDPYYEYNGSFAFAFFQICPARAVITNVKSTAEHQLTVQAKKNRQSNGYQVQIALDKKFKKGKKTINSRSPKVAIHELTSGKRYYVRVRNYKKVKVDLEFGIGDSAKVYGKWSATRTVRCK